VQAWHAVSAAAMYSVAYIQLWFVLLSELSLRTAQQAIQMFIQSTLAWYYKLQDWCNAYLMAIIFIDFSDK
jgi:hypothetical protein